MCLFFSSTSYSIQKKTNKSLFIYFVAHCNCFNYFCTFVKTKFSIFSKEKYFTFFPNFAKFLQTCWKRRNISDILSSIKKTFFQTCFRKLLKLEKINQKHSIVQQFFWRRSLYKLTSKDAILKFSLFFKFWIIKVSRSVTPTRLSDQLFWRNSKILKHKKETDFFESFWVFP